MASRKLAKYRAKRDFGKTAEPSGDTAKGSPGHSYLIQKHAARRLHYDFRLEMDGTLKSWAVTKGPSLNPADKRLAVHVEDHPLAYGDFEGTIPKGQYGGGTVMLWDQGSWEPIGDAARGFKKGHLDFELHGKRLKGRWHLVRMHGNRRGDENRENSRLPERFDRMSGASRAAPRVEIVEPFDRISGGVRVILVASSSLCRLTVQPRSPIESTSRPKESLLHMLSVRRDGYPVLTANFLEIDDDRRQSDHRTRKHEPPKCRGRV